MDSVNRLLLALGLLLAIYGAATPDGSRAAADAARRWREPPGQARTVIARSTQGRAIEAYAFGAGPRWVALVGGLHGGYEWNTTLLAYRMIDELHAHPEHVPRGLRVVIIPAANPDGLAAAVGHAGRFRAEDARRASWPLRLNANGVDLNRNWDCRWQSRARWGSQVVDGGKSPFSEPETRALRDFLTQPPAAAVIFWHSAAGMALPGGCDDRLEQADALARAYADAAGYPVQETFDAYPVSGAAADWLAGQGIPALDVELTDHRNLDWEQNLAGVLAILGALKP